MRSIADRNAPSPAPSPRPGLAAALSLLVPGLGHLLIGERGRGAIWLAGWLVLALLSGAAHSPAVVILMVVAAVDAYALARRPTGAEEHGPPATRRPL